jgi:polar amino acid transport system substrate-binding protein
MGGEEREGRVRRLRGRSRQAIAKKLNREVELQDLGFQALFAATSSGRIDMAISTITITPERLKSQAFTQGYYDSDMALAAGNNTPLKTLSDVKGKTLGALATSTGETWIKENTQKYGIAGMKTYNTQQDLLLDTRNGRVDGAISDLAGMQFTFQKMPGPQDRRAHLDRRPVRHHDEEGLAAPRAGEQCDLRAQEGRHARRLHKKWLGVEADAGTSTVTVTPLPAAM